ncbi:MerC domain-containing protein [Shewanella sp.]|uniref:MerC domain-containing protein n=1 Tax=Shewanella sp. TaxID=50422 RepID=UPI004047589A
MYKLPEITPFLDKYAISVSAMCAVHCLSLPLMLVIFPALGQTILGQELFHVLLLWLVVPLSLISLSLGVKQHRSLLVAFLGLVGLTILMLSAMLGHDGLGELGERLATLLGSIFIVFGHFLNYKYTNSRSN